MAETLDAKLSRLSASAAARSAAATEAEREAWNGVKRDYPDVAAHIAAVCAKFGKPEAVAVKTHAGEVVLRKGRFSRGQR